MAKFEISIDNKMATGTFDEGTRYAVRVYIDIGYGGAMVGDYVKAMLTKVGKSPVQIGRQRLVASGSRLYMAFYWTPTSSQVGGSTIVCVLERNPMCISSIYYANVKSKPPAEPVQHGAYFRVRDDEGNPVNHAKIECAGESFYTDSDGKVVRLYDAGHKYYAQCHAPTEYECVDCYESFYLDSAKFINFYMKATVEPIPEPKAECAEGDKKPNMICVGGKWEDALCAEGTYTADRKKVCRGGVWEDVSAEEPEVPGVPGVSKYLTVAEADERVRTGLPCYIKCVLPILDMLPGFPYTPGAWVPPLCAITKEA